MVRFSSVHPRRISLFCVDIECLDTIYLGILHPPTGTEHDVAHLDRGDARGSATGAVELQYVSSYARL